MADGSIRDGKLGDSYRRKHQQADAVVNQGRGPRRERVCGCEGGVRRRRWRGGRIDSVAGEAQISGVGRQYLSASFQNGPVEMDL